MDKTAGQIHFEFENEGYGLFWQEQDVNTKVKHERIAAAVIAHVRPQIEAEARKSERELFIIELAAVKEQARAAEIADAMKEVDAHDATCGSEDDIICQKQNCCMIVKERIRALAYWKELYKYVQEEVAKAKQAERDRCANLCRIFYGTGKEDLAQAIEQLKD